MKDFRELILAHKGKRIVVMGGAPSLRNHLDELDADVFISCNGHGADIVKPDYVVAMDEKHTVCGTEMGRYVRERTDAPVISPRPYADFQMATWLDAPKTAVLTGMVAAWAAWAMGAKVVILAGMDGYGGAPHAMDFAKTAYRDIKCQVRVIDGGPLTRYWPMFKPSEKFMDYEPHPALDALANLDGMTMVRVLKPVTLRYQHLKPGDTMTGMRHEFARVLKHRMVEEVPMPKAEAPVATVTFLDVAPAPSKPRGKKSKAEPGSGLTAKVA